RVTNAAGRAARQLIVPEHSQAKNVYQGIAFKAFVEINFTADGRNADAISIMRDSGNNPGEEPPVGGKSRICFGFRISDFEFVFIDRSETERVQAKFRTRPHGENIANVPAHTGGGALERLDRARVIMAFHLERDGPAVTDIDPTGVFFAGFH